MKRERRTPIVTVVRRSPARALATATPAQPSAVSQVQAKRAAAPLPSPAPEVAKPAPASVAPATHSKKEDERLRDRDARLAARAAPHAAGIKRLLDEATAANGGAWPRHVHATIADALALPRSVVRAFLGTLRSHP